MKEHFYKYNVAGLQTLIISDHAIDHEKRKDFIRELDQPDNDYDYKVTYVYSEIKAPEPSSIVTKTPSGYVSLEHNKEVFTFFENNRYFAQVHWPEDKNELTCYYDDYGSYLIRNTVKIPALLQLEKMLVQHSGFILHSSIVEYDGKAILFSAPSGTGKSTQADLWKTFANARIINGDRACIRKINDTWYAYGSPFAGTSEIYINEGYPIQALLYLKQGKRNQLIRSDPVSMIRLLYPQITAHYWDQKFINTVLDLLTQLIQKVPVYIYECLPDETSVNYIKKELFG